MTAEDYLRAQIGSLVMEIAMLRAELDKVKKQEGLELA